MKKLFILFYSLLLIQVVSAQKNCCPEFKLVADMEPCMPRVPHNPAGGGNVDFPPNIPAKPDTLGACKHTTHSYYILPNKPGYTYTWAVTGGTLGSTTGNPAKITWGNGSAGLITVYIKSSDGLCKDTLYRNVKLVDAPTAGFNFTPATPVCLNQNITFNNTSVGAAAYYWDFGDGTTSLQTHPSHTYTTPGTYTVTLVAYSDSLAIKQQGKACGCRDTVRQTITVKPEAGLTIEPGCKQMLCKGDTASYCTPNTCTSYNWSVTGGTIIGAANGKCIKVVWNGSYPATVTLNGNCGGACGNSTTLNVPVLYPTMTPTGSNKVCTNSTTNYSLPSMPGTFYNWTVTGSNTIIGSNQNTADINVQWGSTPGTYTIQCDYKNPHTGCNGKATMTVNVVIPFKISGSKVFCEGSPFSLSANGNATWSINPATGFTPSSFPAGNSISGTWTQPGTYTITATTTTPNSFCNTTDVFEVEVFPKPVVNPIIGAVNVCPGSIELYQASSNLNDGFFNWTITGGFITSVLGTGMDSVMIKWNNTGPYAISVTQTVNGCISDPVNLAVALCPAPSFTGSLSACMDVVHIYTSTSPAPPGGYNWALSNGLGTILNGQGTNAVQILWHGSTSGNTCVLTLTTCGGYYSQTITITNPPPLTITQNGSFCSTTNTTLTGSISGGSSYQWSLNNVPLDPPQNTQTITITEPGIYTLEVIKNGCKSKASIIVPEEKLNITATLSTQDKTYWGCNETVSTLLHAAPASSAYCYQWYSASYILGPFSPIVAATSPNYLVNNPGYYYCVISNCNTQCKAITDTIKVTKIPCDDTCTGITNYSVNFTNSLCNPMSFTASTTPAAALGWVHWYFGDGHEGSGINITHQYKDTGTYMVCAVFSNNGYCKKEICKPVTVNIAANFSAVANCDKVTFTNLSKAKNPILSFNWSFPGATPATSNAATPPVITYASGGLHWVTLTVSDGICTVSYQDTVRTYNANATMNVPTPLCVKTDAPFTATSSSPGLNYAWNFGDGFTSNLQNVTHAYQNAGNYTVTLVVTSSSGCTNTYTQNVTVNPAPVVNIGSDQSICVGSTATISAPGGYSTYQWFLNGQAISSATNQNYAATISGEYWVVVSNGPGCVATSNHIKITYKNMPKAKIFGDKIVCTNNIPFSVYNIVAYPWYSYQWNITGPSAGSFSSANTATTTVNIPSKTPGNYEITLIVTDNNTGCRAYDTICVFVEKSPTLNVTAPAGPLCEGKTYTFIASASPSISPQNYIYSWSNGFIGDTLVTGRPGTIMVSVLSPNGCTVSQYAGIIQPRPDVSLFPLGCDTLCLTDTIHFPLPTPIPMGSYTVNWFDDDGTAVTLVGTGLSLPLAGLHPGIHHFFATVSYPGGCSDTTGKYNLYVKDCNLPAPCDNCKDLVDSTTAQPIKVQTGSNSTIVNYNLTFTIKKTVREVRISLADLKYSWKDPACANCKVQVLERGCLFPDAGNTALGSLVWDDYTGSGALTSTANTNCPEELVWKLGSVLQPGTYTLPLQLSLPKPTKKDCVLQLEKICFHLTLIDTLCRSCDQIICASNTIPPEANCNCTISDNWTNLNLLPQKPNVPLPKGPILCNTLLTGLIANTPYGLSGIYHCAGNCISSKNEIVVYNQQNQIIYTRIATTVNEVISFPAPGTYTITLTATCGTKKCACTFKVTVGDSGVIPPGGGIPGGYPPPIEPPVSIPLPPDLPGRIDSIVTATIPPDFNGGVLVAKGDSTLYEKYYSFKDKVNSHTAFDIASITKTFTAAAIMQLIEQRKLNLDDMVAKYLPKFPYNDITIKMLMSHRSGLEDYLQFMDAVGWDKSQTVTNKDLLNIIATNKNKILIHKPGEVYDYSNTNFALLAMVIEAASGESFSKYLDTHFFLPLKMNDSYVLNIDNVAKATKSYYRNGTTYKLRYLDLIYGDKCIYSTPQDLKKWDNALRTGKVLSKASLELANKTIGSPITFSSTYTLGWKKVIAANGKAFYYHDGWWGGSRALLIRLVDENVVIAVLSNNNFTTIKNIKKLCDLFGDYKVSNKKISGF